MRMQVALDKLKAVNPTLYYAMVHHRTHRGKPLDFVNNPFVYRIYQDLHPDISIMKSTQCGISEWLLAVAIPGAIAGRNIFYVLPNGGLIGRFVKERLEKTIKLTPEYAKYARDAGYAAMAAIGMKRFNGTISFTGSNTPTGFTEFAADWYIVDEVDRCDQANLEMGWERLSAAETRYRRQIKVSNPTIPGYGIDAYLADTDQQRWHIKHDCGKWVQPDFFTHIVRECDDGIFELRDSDYDPMGGGDARLICEHCGGAINRRGQGDWVASRAGARRRGYHISKLFSANVEVMDLVRRFEKGQEDPDAMVRFYNGDLGLPYVAAGAKITEADLNDAIGAHRLGNYGKGVRIAGIDVGLVYSVIIGELVPGQSEVKIIQICTIKDTAEVIEALRVYNVRCFVIDGLPETRESRRICEAVKGGYMAAYGGARTEKVGHRTVSIERTAALDNVKHAIVTKAVILPAEAARVNAFYPEMTSSVRMFDPDANGGEGAYRWEEGSKADHYMHSMGYMLIAGRILVTVNR